MRFFLFLFVVSFSLPTLADTRFSQSVGTGPQYGGVLGWQGRVSGERLHGRVALGLIGVSAGVDVTLNDQVLLGLTRSEVLYISMTGVGLTLIPGGDYTEGWQIGLEAGRGDSDWPGAQRRDFEAVVFSIGYAF